MWRNPCLPVVKIEGSASQQATLSRISVGLRPKQCTTLAANVLYSQFTIVDAQFLGGTQMVGTEGAVACKKSVVEEKFDARPRSHEPPDQLSGF